MLWLRRSSGGDLFSEFIAIGGSYLSIDGNCLVNLSSIVEHVSGEVPGSDSLVITTGPLPKQEEAVGRAEVNLCAE
jgi:hypothetical protein